MFARMSKLLVKPLNKNVRNLRLKCDTDAFGNEIHESRAVVYDASSNVEKISNGNKNLNNHHVKYVGAFTVASALGYAFFSSENNSTKTTTAEITVHSRPFLKKP